MYYITPAHKGEHEVMSIQKIILLKLRPYKYTRSHHAFSSTQQFKLRYTAAVYIYVCITPTHKGEHGVMRIQTIIMRTRTHSMQATSNLLRGPHIPQARPTRPRHVTQVGALIPITTPPPCMHVCILGHAVLIFLFA
jgi:hypothetical protein